MMRRFAGIAILVALAILPARAQQDWIRTGTGLGVEKPRIAVVQFPAPAVAPDVAQAFNETLWNDLESAGIFELVSRSFYPLQQPGRPEEVKLDAWAQPPVNAGMLVFGNAALSGGDLLVQGWLYDTRNPASPQVLGKQYRDPVSVDAARVIAHRFANEIIFRLGGGVAGITESKIVFISARSGSKEVWMMDYDGAGQRRLTGGGGIALSPRISPDSSRVAYSAIGRNGWDIQMYSLVLNRNVAFPALAGSEMSPAWSPDGSRMAFTSTLRGDPEIFLADANGSNVRRLTSFRGPDVSPVWNPKTGTQIAFVSGRTGLPQIYMMDADGANEQRLTDGGYAVSPSWSPNGQFLAFAWIRRYGPGAPGAQDIYVMDITTKQWVQLTHNAGRNDFPSWSPDGRHIVFQSTRAGRDQIWTMLADGSQQRQLTTAGTNTQPNWSWK